MAAERPHASYWLTPTRLERARLWLTHKLLATAWRVLPRWHPARRGIFDAGCALRDPVLSDNLAKYESAAQALRERNARREVRP